MRCVSLLRRSLPVFDQDPINACRYFRQLAQLPLLRLGPRRHRTVQCLANHPPVHAKLPRYPGNGPHAELVLPAYLLE